MIIYFILIQDVQIHFDVIFGAPHLGCIGIKYVIIVNSRAPETCNFYPDAIFKCHH